MQLLIEVSLNLTSHSITRQHSAYDTTLDSENIARDIQERKGCLEQVNIIGRS
jgi:hypothetical protein